MTKWLASVQSLAEAQTLISCLPDILDLKNPSQGALGALSVYDVETIVQWLDGRCLTSATVGDLPMKAPVIAEAVTAMASTGVDYVKVGLFADKNLQSCLLELKTTLVKLKTPTIAVVFADQKTEIDLSRIKQAGFAGVMVDTATKDGLRLFDHWSEQQLRTFVSRAHELNMLCGLAGALAIDDITLLQPFNADYLGFRSALCDKRQRTQALQLSLAMKIADKMQSEISLAS